MNVKTIDATVTTTLLREVPQRRIFREPICEGKSTLVTNPVGIQAFPAKAKECVRGRVRIEGAHEVGQTWRHPTGKAVGENKPIYVCFQMADERRMYTFPLGDPCTQPQTIRVPECRQRHGMLNMVVSRTSFSSHPRRLSSGHHSNVDFRFLVLWESWSSARERFSRRPDPTDAKEASPLCRACVRLSHGGRRGSQPVTSRANSPSQPRGKAQ